jgi:hypothetical protein
VSNSDPHVIQSGSTTPSSGYGNSGRTTPGSQSNMSGTSQDYQVPDNVYINQHQQMPIHQNSRNHRPEYFSGQYIPGTFNQNSIYRPETSSNPNYIPTYNRPMVHQDLSGSSAYRSHSYDNSQRQSMSKRTTTNRTRTQQSDPTPANIPAAHPQHNQSWEDPWNTTIPSHYKKMEEKMQTCRSGSKRTSVSRSDMSTVDSDSESVESGCSGTKMAKLLISDSQSKIIMEPSNQIFNRLGDVKDLSAINTWEKTHPKKNNEKEIKKTIIMEDSNSSTITIKPNPNKITMEVSNASSISTVPTDAIDSFLETDEASQTNQPNRINELASNASIGCPPNIEETINLVIDSRKSTKKEPKSKKCKAYKPPTGKRK